MLVLDGGDDDYGVHCDFETMEASLAASDLIVCPAAIHDPRWRPLNLAASPSAGHTGRY